MGFGGKDAPSSTKQEELIEMKKFEDMTRDEIINVAGTMAQKVRAEFEVRAELPPNMPEMIDMAYEIEELIKRNIWES